MTVPGGAEGPVSVRLRLGERRVLVVPACRAWGTAPPSAMVSPKAEPPPAPPLRPSVPAPADDLSRLHHRAVVVIVEAVPSRAEALAATVLTAYEARGLRCAGVSLEPQNRLAGRFGCMAPSNPGAWSLGAAALATEQGARLIVPSPVPEDGLDPAAVTGVLSQLAERAELVLVDLGCRWVPRLFRPVVAQATQIWMVARAGQWTGVEMRLEQAELSGWTPMHKVRLVVVGEEPTVPPGLAAILAGVIRDPESQGAVELMTREVGRMGR